MSNGCWKVPQNPIYIIFAEDFNVYGRLKTEKPTLERILKDEGTDP